MKTLMAAALLIGITAVLAGCGGSDSKNATPAASVAASTKAAATTASGSTPAATKAAASPSAAAATSAPSSSGGGDCKYLSDADASALHPSAGAVKVTSADTPAAKQTTCSWATISDGVVVIVNEVKISAAIDAIKNKLNGPGFEKIDGLGDLGGFETKSADAVSVVFVKGSTQVLLTVSGTSVNADAVAAAAKKIAAKL